MKVVQVRVQNYKIVRDSGWIDIDEQITTFIGENESGKTSILEAIASFSDNEQYDDSDLNNVEDISNKEETPVVSIRYLVEENDPSDFRQLSEDSDCSLDDNIISFTKYADGHRSPNVDSAEDELAWERGRVISSTRHRIQKLKKWLRDSNLNTGDLISDLPNESNFSLNDPTGARRILRESKKSYEGDDIYTNDTLESLNNYILADLDDNLANINSIRGTTVDIFRYLVRVEYYDDINVIDDQIDMDELDSEKHGALLKLFESHGIDLRNLDDVGAGELTRATDEINDSVQKAINDIWDQKSINLSISPPVQDRIATNLWDESVRRTNEINDEKDATNVVDRRSGPMSERSKGYKWFIAFYLNYSAELSNSDGDLLLLFDDPAVYLHPRGKRDWLETIEDVSDETQVVYSSHSPFLINKKYPERLRMVEDVGQTNQESGTQVTNRFSNSSAGSLEPVRKSLGIRLGDSPFVSHRTIFVEGLSEYHIIFGISHYLKHREGKEDVLDISEVSVISVDGASEMSTWGKWAESEGLEYALLLDNDEAGRIESEKISEFHTEIPSNRVVLLGNQDDVDEHSNFEVEDMFSPKNYVLCLNEVYCEKYEDFERIDVEKAGDGWKVGSYECHGDGIIDIIRKELDSQDNEIDHILKKKVAKELKSQLISNSDFELDNERRFKILLGELRSRTA